ncbi:restriction endonuclease subunit S [Campylobacter lari]|uniref:restriction endonuclease subunit S n=2 Tax=Campylobacter lari TaxID=201 RepID=UPI000943AB84|nr:restriction endonuclease subunit S [Campylobacter lari]ECK1937788.1 restriction endonuclease subunit S [Campylobacter lari]EGK8079889.1 restriction endonuclease subunit S [Campylobacter lari]ELZ2501149.1 restriction endonuclease subunit S [Campylobacter lari]MCV3524844.1 restriction endonuclease subunit S [Campylobacter lari]MCW0260922.1 restriction endonuclease subunit S [Campylobacter lari]
MKVWDNKMTNLPQGWEKFNFDNIFYSPSSKNYQLNTKDYLGKGCIPIIDQSKKFIIGYSNNYEKIFKINNCNNSCIIFGDHTRVLKFIDFDFIVGADGVKILLNKDIERFNTKFLFFQLLYKDIPLLGYRRHFSVLKQNTFIIPPLKEQERIVEILDESFTKIDESIKILEQDLLNLDELMQSALQKAFNPLKDNTKENYKLPQDWEWKSLGEICFITDGTHKTPSYIKTGIPFLSVKNISKGFFDLSDIKYISLEEHNKLIKRAKPEFGDILICRIGTLGKAIKISLEFEFSIFVSLGLLKPKVKIISDYLVYFLNSYFIEGWIDNNKVGGGTHAAKLNLNILEKCPIALPPLKEQEQIASHLDELSSHVKNLKQNYQMQIKDLQELKKSLLDKAFQGRL